MASDDEEEVDVFTDAEQTVAEPGRRAPSSPPPPSLPPRTLPATATSSTLGASSDASARAPEASTSTAAPTAGPTRGRTLRLAIYGVFVVSFSHQVGPIVDWSYPPDISEEALEEIKKDLPFFALPDGAHLSVSDACYFHFLVPHLSHETVFGTSVHRQLDSSELIVPDKEVTRNNIQKAVVVLANAPVFGAIKDKLKIATEAWFAQRNFSDRTILVDLFNSMVVSPTRDGETRGWLLRVPDTPEAAMLVGTSVRELLHRYRYHVLRLVKLLLLQRKILFYGRPTETLCVLQYSLVSLIPELMNNLHDSGSPFLSLHDRVRTRPTSLRTSDRASLLRYLGLPLDIFGEDCAFMPFASLHNVDTLRSGRSYLMGTSNALLLGEADVDAVVYLESWAVEVKKPAIAAAIAPSAADRKWMDALVARVDASFDAEQPMSETFEGSDDAIRADFELYISSLLAATKFAKAQCPDPILAGLDDNDPLPAWNAAFLDMFRRTRAYDDWDRRTDDALFDLVDPSHPCAGAKSLSIENIGLRLGDTLKDYGMEERLAASRAAISKGSDSFWKMADNFKQNAQKRSFRSFFGS